MAKNTILLCASRNMNADSVSIIQKGLIHHKLFVSHSNMCFSSNHPNDANQCRHTHTRRQLRVVTLRRVSVTVAQCRNCH